jgi:TPP-dependent pyruvate/acetoin dehydrogenase alpha subunit
MREICGDLELLRSMMLIRRFEEALELRPDRGFQLLSSGEEAVAVGVCAVLNRGDQLLCSGRSIAPSLARGLNPSEVMAELLGKSAGPCRGKGGRGHLAAPSFGFFGAHAVVGGNLTIAAGVALAMQQKRRPGVVACIFGDGACGSGVLHETLNMAAIWKLPLLLICNNNQYSISTHASAVLAPRSLADLALPFGIPAKTVDGMDVLAVRDATQDITENIRRGAGPGFLECISYRFSTHSTATSETRSAAEIAEWKGRCPIAKFASQLEAQGKLPKEGLNKLADEIAQTINGAIALADIAPFPMLSEALTDVV